MGRVLLTILMVATYPMVSMNYSLLTCKFNVYSTPSNLARGHPFYRSFHCMYSGHVCAPACKWRILLKSCVVVYSLRTDKALNFHRFLIRWFSRNYWDVAHGLSFVTIW